MLSVSKKLVSVSLTWKGGSTLGPQLALPWRKGEGRRQSTREGWHDLPVIRGGWPGETASGHSTSRHGEVKTAGGLPVKVGTTRLSCRVGGRDGRPLVTARLAMERLARLAGHARWVAGLDGLWSQHVSPWRGEDRGWSTREGPSGAKRRCPLLNLRMRDLARFCPHWVQHSAQARYLPILVRHVCACLSHLPLKLSLIRGFCTNVHKLAAESISLFPDGLQLCAPDSLDGALYIWNIRMR
ncbi:hypothetical protein CRG98_003793 [Punica granatum]|uniref:Uncharacterized protein n=1 Tax=Punica granatum TaxID=22663 RepID=A0A2I0L5A9_PUNGR|nr:hypothetical protein CRG98_003793 [Punica granatum]